MLGKFLGFVKWRLTAITLCQNCTFGVRILDTVSPIPDLRPVALPMRLSAPFPAFAEPYAYNRQSEGIPP
jgi:hypothetical protein